jgi:hypothetical protein
MSRNVAVMTGMGCRSQAVARRIGPVAHLLLADFNEEILDMVAMQLHGGGVRELPVAWCHRGGQRAAVSATPDSGSLSPGTQTGAALSTSVGVSRLGCASVRRCGGGWWMCWSSWRGC